jgi:ABC-type nitrate/sulfonate/bicarbonate transport system substrate-binding protein
MQTRRSFSKVLAAVTATGIAPFARRSFAAAPAIKTVRLADQPGAEVDYAAVWIAEGLGYFEEQGIKIERHSYANGPAAMLDFPSGSIDAVMAAIVPFMQFAARGGEFKLIMSLTREMRLLLGLKNSKRTRTLMAKRSARRALARSTMLFSAMSKRRKASSCSMCTARSLISPS